MEDFGYRIPANSFSTSSLGMATEEGECDGDHVSDDIELAQLELQVK